jgi:quercetin dioxygenase-like cupin family protein
MLSELFSDVRGKILKLELNGKEFVILVTKKGYLRGGDFHKSVQHDVVLEGAVRFFWREDGIERKLQLTEGMSISFKPGVPHMLEAIEDSIVLEWLEGPFEKEYYKPYREIIERAMK